MDGYRVVEHRITATDAELLRPSGEHIVQLLATSPAFAGIGEVKARRLWERLGESLYDCLDQADEDTLAQIRREIPDALEVSALTGQGIDALMARLDERLPDPRMSVDVVVPFERGDLVSRVYSVGTDVTIEHVAEGTHVQAKVPADLGAALVDAGQS